MGEGCMCIVIIYLFIYFHTIVPSKQQTLFLYPSIEQFSGRNNGHYPLNFRPTDNATHSYGFKRTMQYLDNRKAPAATHQMQMTKQVKAIVHTVDVSQSLSHSLTFLLQISLLPELFRTIQPSILASEVMYWRPHR